MRYPIECGIVSDWEDMESIWHHTLYNELHASPEEHPIMLTDSPLNPKCNREKMAEIMFETFNCPGLYIITQAVLSLYATGFLAGVVLVSGEDMTHVVPVYDSYKLSHAVKSVGLGALMQQLNRRGYSFSTEYDRGIVQSIKERMLYVSNGESNGTAEDRESYELPDGQKVILGRELSNCAEILFNPTLLRSELDGMHNWVYRSIKEFDFDKYKQLITHIVLAGGNTC